MLKSTHLRDVQRATETLAGVLDGVACDYELTDLEIAQLKNWLDTHVHLRNIEPFASLWSLTATVLADQVITEDEREDILAFCHEWNNLESNEHRLATAAMRHIQGFLQGLAFDSIVTPDEIRGLKDWMELYREFEHDWPFCDAWKLAKKILADNKVTLSEQKAMLNFCMQFNVLPIFEPSCETHDPKTSRWMISTAPVVKTITSILDRDVRIEFQRKLFCFTGRARSGKRAVLEEMVRLKNGTTHPTVIFGLDYLVIGALSQPVWAYELYGRKIELAMENRQRGSFLKFIHEDDFLSAVEKITL